MYRRPDIALVIALAGFAASWAVLSVYGGITAAPWLQQTIDLVVISAPAVAAVFVAVVVAGRPGFWRRVLVVRGSDLLLGLGVGLTARALVEVVSPTTGSLLAGFGGASLGGIAVLIVGAAIVTPIVEELYFRGLIVPAVAEASAGAGRIVAAVTSVVVSTVAFVALHYIASNGAASWPALIGPAAVSVGCGILFLLTGRLGGPIVAHVVFNAIGVALLIW
ncbi:hypothetical protein GCM10025760_24280 [Microbacterium yannicii]|uniref:CAAX prenyl protease 2/Lysostaphin resistance protein A-like domain-containing protein n=1 Tax=Microbacterium yannicii TaxID=671622 RepID=A0ABP9MEC5_9MICO